MTTYSLVPSPIWKFFANDGTPLANGKVTTYAAGTTTPAPTYSSYTGAANTNPIVLNARGECAIYLQQNVGYKFAVTDSSGNQIPGWPQDNIYATQALISLYGGTDSGYFNNYILNFSTPYQNIAAYTGTPIYWIPSATNTGATQITVNGLGPFPIVNPGGSALSSNQIIGGAITSIIYVGGSFYLLQSGSPSGTAIGTFGQEVGIASAATTDLGSTGSHVVLVTGSTGITSFGSAATVLAPIYHVRFTGSLTMTYNSTSLILPGLSSITTQSGDALIAQYLGSGNWKVLFYQLGQGSLYSKIKAGNTVRTATATPTVDSDLYVNNLPTGNYEYEILLNFDSAAATIGFQWENIGTAIDTRLQMPCIVTGLVAGVALGPTISNVYSTLSTFGSLSTIAFNNMVLYKGSMLVSTAGSYSIAWSQSTSNAAAVTLRQGSYLTFNPISTNTSTAMVQRTYTIGATETIPSGHSSLILEAWGGGGSGGVGENDSVNNWAGGGGGGSGSYAKKTLNVAGAAGETIVFTGGGPGLGFTSIGGTGTGSTFTMTNITVSGGSPGGTSFSFITPGNGGTGGVVGTGGDVNTAGNSGSAGAYTNIDTANGGAGGAALTGTYASGNPGGAGGGADGVAYPVQVSSASLIVFTYS